MLSADSKILIVDDFQLIRKMIQDALTELGYKKIEQATDGQEALNKVEAAHKSGEPYQLVFCDWNMPNMTGYEFLLKCRQSDDFKNLPIVMVTAESEQVNVVKAIKAGATDYLVKPLSKGTLHKKLEKLNDWLSKRAS
jgi:two-component system chemotaxis response regulator CheY